MERALVAELTHHLGYVPHARHQAQNGTVRHGTSAKTVETDHGPLARAVPRERAGTFEPTVVKTRQRRLEGFADKVVALYCIVHTVRQALRSVVWIERRAVARDLSAISRASPLKEAEEAFEQVAQTWAAKYPTLSTSWRRDGDRLTVCFDDPPEIRTVSDTTNAIESLHCSLRKILKKRGAFPTDEAILNVLDLGMQRIAKNWTVPIPEWKRALNQFAML